jgi:hypothetical protein
MLAWMADALEPDAEDRKLRERLAGRVGRQVEGVASVRPATRDGWISWVGMGVDDSMAPILTAAVAFTATLSAQERRRARATGLATRMALAVTEHEAHLFRTRAMGRIIGDHVMTVPYGMVTKVTVGKKESARMVASLVEDMVGKKESARIGVSLVKVTIDLTDGSKIKLDGDAKHRRVFEQLQASAAAVPVGTVAPAPAQQPEPTVARVLALAAGHVAKGAVNVGGQVRAARKASK